MSTTTITAPDPAGAADTTDFTAIHSCLRLGGRAIALAVARLDPADHHRAAALGRYWRGYAGEVLAHHTVEDKIMYPALVARRPRIAELLAQVDDDHHELDELMAAGHEAMATVVAGASPARAADVLAALDRLMHEHLDFEDAELVPLFRAHFTHEEYAAMSAAAAKSLGLGRQALFTVPFIGSWLTPDDRAHLLADAPLPFRILYRLTRRRHERLVDAALGEVRDEVVANSWSSRLPVWA